MPETTFDPRGQHPSARRRRRLTTVLAAGALLAGAGLGLAACGSDDEESSSTGTTASQSTASTAITKNDANAKTTITLGSKNFTEQQVLGEVYAQALEAAGYTVKREFNLGDEKTALAALKGDQISAYPEYTGTALGSFFGLAGDKIPKDPQEAYELVKTDIAKDDITALPPTPFTSSNEVAVTQATADKYKLTNISDLKPVAGELGLYGSPECRSRLDCLKGLQDVYGLEFKSFTPVDLSLRHTVLENGKADVSIVFTTDPQNARDKLVLLKDDQGMFPPYNSTLLVRDDVIDEAGPDFAKTIELVNSKLDAKAIQELNAKKDLDKESAADAAKSYLTSFGFVQ